MLDNTPNKADASVESDPARGKPKPVVLSVKGTEIVIPKPRRLGADGLGGEAPPDFPEVTTPKKDGSGDWLT